MKTQTAAQIDLSAHSHGTRFRASSDIAHSADAENFGNYRGTYAADS